MWVRSDWREFFRTIGKRWEKYRPPRPVDLSGRGGVLPTAGFSLRELNDAGISLELAESLGLPVDVGRVSAYEPNVTALRDFARTARGTS